MDVESKLFEPEDCSRRFNLRIDGIPQRPREKWEQCEEKVTGMIISKLEIDDEVKIEGAHQTKSKSNKNNKNQKRKSRQL